MALELNGTTGVSLVQDGVVTAADLASGAITAAALPAGSVLQVVNATSVTGFGTTSTSFVATNSQATITPYSNTSKILIFATAPLYAPGNDYHIYSTIYRDSTNLSVNNEGLMLFSTGASGGGRWSNGVIQYYDSPSTTNSITYTVYVRTLSGGNISYPAGGDQYSAVITLMEIAA